MEERFGVNLIAALSRKTAPPPDPLEEFFACALWKRVLAIDAEKFVRSINSGIPQA